MDININVTRAAESTRVDVSATGVSAGDFIKVMSAASEIAAGVASGFLATVSQGKGDRNDEWEKLIMSLVRKIK